MIRIPVVNEKDEIIRYKDRNDRNSTDIIRVSGLWVLNLKGEVLIARRASGKIRDGGKWGPSAAGTVEEGETYLSNILKEAKEEIGLKINEGDLMPDSRHYYVETSHKFFCRIYFIKLDLPISFFKTGDEVSEVKWVNIDELKKWFEDSPQDFISSFKPALSTLS